MCARREPVQVAQTVGPAHCPPFPAGPARASGGREAARLMTVPRNGGPRSGPYSAKRTLAGSATFWGDGRGWRAGPAPGCGAAEERKTRGFALERAVQPELAWLPACSHPASDRVNRGAGWAPSFQLALSSFESLAWLLALFGPGHACKGSRSELLQQKRARGHCLAFACGWPWLSSFGVRLAWAKIGQRELAVTPARARLHVFRPLSGPYTAQINNRI